MSANPEDKSSWSEIFKYLPSLRQMVSCFVCGNIAFRPQGPDHNVCLHFVCESCKGGKMRLKPSCSWCKDHDAFVDNKRVSLLINCFKRLCLYISSSSLGRELINATVNGHGNEADKVLKIIEEVGNFEDEITLTPPPQKMPKISKLLSQHVKPKQSSDLIFKPSTSNKSRSRSSQQRNKSITQVKRGRPSSVAKSIATATVKARSNVAHHVKRLKKKALSTQVKKTSPGTISFARRRHINKSQTLNSSSYLISNRPHRERNGKYSIGQLWRETFLEEDHRDVLYPDSGIEVGNSSDQDQCIQPSSLEPLQDKSELERTNKEIEVSHKETRSHSLHHPNSKNVTVTFENAVTSSTDVNTNDKDNAENKPRLMLTISKKAMAHYPNSRRGMRSTINSAFVVRKKPKTSELPLSRHNINKKERALVSRQTHSRNSKSKTAIDICKCARFKQPNHLTCFGQKCPCYSEKRACVECLCNGCKNPLRVSPDSAPPLMRFVRETADVSAHNRSMPRLSPIPKV